MARPGGWFAAAGGLALMAVLGFASLGTIESLRSSAAAAETMGAESFRIGWVVLALYAIALLDVVVAWGLWQVFRIERPGGAALAAAFRIAYAAVFVGAIAQLDHALRIVTATDDRLLDPAAREAMVDAQVQGFDAAWNGGLMLFAAHLAVVAWLLLRLRGAFATVVGVLVAIAAGGYAIDSAMQVVAPELGVRVTTFTFIGEVVLIAWLVAGGLRAARHDRSSRLERDAVTRPPVGAASKPEGA